MNTLIIGEESRFAMPLSQILIKNKIPVEFAPDSALGLYYTENKDIDLILMDLYLPNENGFDFIKKLRKLKVVTPLIVISERNAIDDKVRALDFGADDYIEIPFSSDELLARMRAACRRKSDYCFDNVLYFADIYFELQNYRLHGKNGSVLLTSKEGRLLEYLLIHKNSYRQRDEIYMKCWNMETDIAYNGVEVYISFLRKKLLSVGSEVTIKMNRNVGYRIVYEKP